MRRRQVAQRVQRALTRPVTVTRAPRTPMRTRTRRRRGFAPSRSTCSPLMRCRHCRSVQCHPRSARSQSIAPISSAAIRLPSCCRRSSPAARCCRGVWQSSRRRTIAPGARPGDCGRSSLRRRPRRSPRRSRPQARPRSRSIPASPSTMRSSCASTKKRLRSPTGRRLKKVSTLSYCLCARYHECHKSTHEVFMERRA